MAKRLLTRLLATAAKLRRTSGLIWEASGRWSVIWAILLALGALLPVAQIGLTRMVVDGLVSAPEIGADWSRLQPVLISGVLLVAVIVAGELARSALDWVRVAQAELIQDSLSTRIQQHAARADLACFESAEFYDQLHRARGDAANRTLGLLESIGSSLQSGLTLLLLLFLLLPFGLWVPVALLLGAAPALLVVVRTNRRSHRWWERTTQERRWAQYFETMLTHNVAAAEIRLFNLAERFGLAYSSIRTRLRGERLALLRDQSLARLAASAVGVFVSGGALAVIGYRMVQREATAGDLVLAYQAFTQGQSLLRGLLSGAGQIYASTLFLDNLFDFLDTRPQVNDPGVPAPTPSAVVSSVRFANVGFCYPGSDRPALSNFDLELPAGRVTAIVGANGAGKSTLVKLLCRFYDPDAGQVSIDGRDIREFAIDDLRRLITVLFQMPVSYHASAAENIALSALDSAPDPVALEVAARSAGAHEIIERLPQGYATLLGKWFADGTDLSGGEWQRLALARAFLRQAPILILDEPTSFMDSWAELEWLDRLGELVRGRTTLIITHRFTTAMRANMIHVMDQGKLVESGTHEELLATGGLYAHSWAAQTSARSLTADEVIA